MAEQSVAGNRLVIVGPARVAVVMARQEAGMTRSRLVGSEHLLIGLVRERNGVAAKVLGGLGVTLDKVRHCAQASADRAHGDPETEDLSPAGLGRGRAAALLASRALRARAGAARSRATSATTTSTSSTCCSR